jgi:hypothetical protein
MMMDAIAGIEAGCSIHYGCEMGSENKCSHNAVELTGVKQAIDGSL